MTKERFAEICRQEGFSVEETIDEAWAIRPLCVDTYSDEDLRSRIRLVMATEEFKALQRLKSFAEDIALRLKAGLAASKN